VKEKGIYNILDKKDIHSALINTDNTIFMVLVWFRVALCR